MSTPFLRVTPARRLAFFVVIDALLVVASFAVAALLRFDGAPPADLGRRLLPFGALGVISTVAALFALGTYRVSWSFVGLRDVGRISIAIGAATILVGIVAQVLHDIGSSSAIPRGIVLIQAPISFCAIAGFRVLKRGLQALVLTNGPAPAARERTLLVGAGASGAQVLKSIRETNAAYQVLGFVDDDRLAQGTRIHGVPVLGPTTSLARHIEALRIECVILCVTSANSTLVRSVVEMCREAGVNKVRIVPPLSQIVDGNVSIQATRAVSLEDFLGREPIHIDHGELREIFRGRRVLVTGAAGTIGSELTRQLARLGPYSLVAVDVDETRLHDLAVDLRQEHPEIRLKEALVDVRNAQDVGALLSSERPHVVFHAAAYKHVPMMELYPLAALETNVLGTLILAEAAEAHGCERFVLISTDKAVEPSSVMGASKRLAELAVLAGGGRSRGAMLRSAVRFGNVIGSRGSVIPIFERQLERGGPLTVTHPDMKRFFMMTSEAVSLVLQSSALGKGGDLFVLDMGKPVRILDVAHEFIRLHGLEPEKDISITITGLRVGEKLEESLTYSHERLAGTRHPRILQVEGSGVEAYPGGIFERTEALVRSRDEDGARRLLRDLFETLDDPPTQDRRTAAQSSRRR